MVWYTNGPCFGVGMGIGGIFGVGFGRGVTGTPVGVGVPVGSPLTVGAGVNTTGAGSEDAVACCSSTADVSPHAITETEMSKPPTMQTAIFTFIVVVIMLKLWLSGILVRYSPNNTCLSIEYWPSITRTFFWAK